MLKLLIVSIVAGTFSAGAPVISLLPAAPLGLDPKSVGPAVSQNGFSGGFIDYSKVKPENHVALAIRYAESTLRSSLMDPEGMRLDTSETASTLKLGICANGANNEGHRFKLWATTISINSTDAYGSYTGVKPYTLFFKQGEIIASQQAHPNSFDERPTADGYYFPCNSVN